MAETTVINKATSVTGQMRTFYDKAFLETMKDELVITKFGLKKRIPRNSGQTISLRTRRRKAPAITPLTEGENPVGTAVEVDEVVATISEYGDYEEYSSTFSNTAPDLRAIENTEVQSQQAAETIETVTFAALTTGTNVFYASGATSREAVKTGNKKINFEDCRKLVRTLKRASAKRIEGFYIMIVSPEVEFDLGEDTRFIEASKYAAPERLKDGLLGKMAGIEFYTSNFIPKIEVVGSNDIHQNVCFGKNSFAVTDLEGKDRPQVIIKSKDKIGGPLNRKSTQGWVIEGYVAKIVNQLALIRYECCATDSAS